MTFLELLEIVSPLTSYMPRCLKRVGNLATNIGERVTFIIEGINIQHQKVNFD
jgi:phosphate uptake regulator